MVSSLGIKRDVMRSFFVFILTVGSSHGAPSFRAPFGTVALDAWGDGIRLRVAPGASPIVDPSVMALLPTPPAPSVPTSASGSSVTVGDLTAASDPHTGLVVFSRVSTGAVLLNITAFKFGAAARFARPGSVSAAVDFSGLTPGEKVYGLGEHAGSAVGVTQLSTVNGLENNGELTIPWFVSSRGYGFLWNVPSYGNLTVGAAAMEWASDAT